MFILVSLQQTYMISLKQWAQHSQSTSPVGQGPTHCEDIYIYVQAVSMPWFLKACITLHHIANQLHLEQVDSKQGSELQPDLHLKTPMANSLL